MEFQNYKSYPAMADALARLEATKAELDDAENGRSQALWEIERLRRKTKAEDLSPSEKGNIDGEISKLENSLRHWRNEIDLKKLHHENAKDDWRRAAQSLNAHFGSTEGAVLKTTRAKAARLEAEAALIVAKRIEKFAAKAEKEAKAAFATATGKTPLDDFLAQIQTVEVTPASVREDIETRRQEAGFELAKAEGALRNAG